MNLLDAEVGVTYTVSEIDTDDEDLRGFLLRLGCYAGEPIAVVSKKKKGKGMVVAIKDGRYNIDSNIADAIKI